MQSKRVSLLQCQILHTTASSGTGGRTRVYLWEEDGCFACLTHFPPEKLFPSPAAADADNATRVTLSSPLRWRVGLGKVDFRTCAENLRNVVEMQPGCIFVHRYTYTDRQMHTCGAVHRQASTHKSKGGQGGCTQVASFSLGELFFSVFDDEDGVALLLFYFDSVVLYCGMLPSSAQ